MKRKNKRLVREMIRIVRVMLLVVVFIGIFSFCNYVETHYTREAEVIEIEEDGIVVVEDTTHNLWAFDDTECKVGDKVELVMNTNLTDSCIEDDTIEKVKIIK